MGLWSALRRRLRKDSGAVGSELIGAFETWGLTNAGVPVNAISALQHVGVMACVSIISEDIAKLPLALYRRLPDGGKELAADHYFNRLLKRPNAWQTRFEFIEMMQAALVLRNNAYAVIVRNERGDPLYLVPIHPDRVSIYEAADGEYFYFVSRNGLHEMAVLRNVPWMIPSEDVLHLRSLSTWNSLLGTSRVAMMREAIGLAMSQEEQSARFAGSGARPSGILTTDQKLSPEVKEQLKSDWRARQSGVRNAGATAVLEQGLKWEPLSMTLVDAEWLASRNWQLRDIARGFRVPGYKLGIEGEKGDIQQDQDYLNNVLVPYCTRWTEKLEFTFEIDRDDPDLFLSWDYEAFLSADIKTRYEALRTGVVGSLITINEARAKLGYPSVEGGDTLLQPTNMAPIGWVPSNGGNGPGSDMTGQPAPGGDGDPLGLPGETAPKGNQ